MAKEKNISIQEPIYVPESEGPGNKREILEANEWETIMRMNYDDSSLKTQSTFDLVTHLNLINLLLIGLCHLNSNNIEEKEKNVDEYYNFDDTNSDELQNQTDMKNIVQCDASKYF